MHLQPPRGAFEIRGEYLVSVFGFDGCGWIKKLPHQGRVGKWDMIHFFLGAGVVLNLESVVLGLRSSFSQICNTSALILHSR